MIVVMWQRARLVELPTIMCACDCGEALPSSVFSSSKTPSSIPPKTRLRWKRFEGPLGLLQPRSLHCLRSQKNQRHELRLAARNGPRHLQIPPLPLPQNKNGLKLRNLSNRSTGTRNTAVSAPNQAENSQKSRPSHPLTSSKPSPTSIRFQPYLSHVVQACFFSPGVQATLDSLEWERTNLVNFTSRSGTSG